MMILFTLFYTLTLSAEECAVIKERFEREEQAYDVVAEIAIASNSGYEIISKFIKATQTLLKSCPKSISLDHQYTLKRKLNTAKTYQHSYKVFTQEQLAQYARTHPEHVVVYKWGTIKAVR